MKRVLVLLLAALCVAAVLAGCSQSPETVESAELETEEPGESDEPSAIPEHWVGTWDQPGGSVSLEVRADGTCAIYHEHPDWPGPLEAEFQSGGDTSALVQLDFPEDRRAFDKTVLYAGMPLEVVLEDPDTMLLSPQEFTYYVRVDVDLDTPEADIAELMTWLKSDPQVVRIDDLSQYGELRVQLPTIVESELIEYAQWLEQQPEFTAVAIRARSDASWGYARDLGITLVRTSDQ